MVSKGSFPFNNNKKKVNYRKVKNHRKVSPAKHNHVVTSLVISEGGGSRLLIRIPHY